MPQRLADLRKKQKVAGNVFISASVCCCSSDACFWLPVFTDCMVCTCSHTASRLGMAEVVQQDRQLDLASLLPPSQADAAHSPHVHKVLQLFC